jgi:hypothetical protein
VEQQYLPGMDIEALAAADEGISYAEAQRISSDAREEWEHNAPEQDKCRALYGAYLDLSAAGWPWRQAMYIAWARMSARGRWPETLDELANLMGLRSPRTVRTWRHKNPEIDRQVREFVVRGVADRSAEVLEAAFASATGEGYRGFNDRRMLLEIGGVYRQQQDVTVTAVNADAMAQATREAQIAAADFEAGRFGESEEKLPFDELPPTDEEHDDELNPDPVLGDDGLVDETGEDDDDFPF